MKSKQPSIRPAGQRSITSTVLFRDPKRSSVCDKDVGASTQQGSQLSLSDFLKRKVRRTSAPHSSRVNYVCTYCNIRYYKQGKEQPFMSPLSCEVSNSNVVGVNSNDGGEADANLSIDSVLQMLKNNGEEKKDCSNISAPNDTHDLQQARNRENPFEVLGDGLRPILSRKRKKFSSKEESKPLFNHYENGGGWWDDNMEGIDSENVGCSSAWEGVGCTTLGGIEWH
ncbi:uncharacterized protein LOC142550844 isoform X3 [Primulina tabacum]|uniref:uncharacterized protein LOC142550844 isoform X3 n=1 Tax=Primulina tabacum TaxID=48773 RepID=UPI003F5A37A1